MSVLTLGEIAERIGGELRGKKERPVQGVAPPEDAVDDDIVFVRDRKLLEQYVERETVSFILDFYPEDGSNLDYIYIPPEEKDRVFIDLLSLFEEEGDFGSSIAEAASVSEKASIGKGVVLDEYSLVGENTSIGENTRIGAQCSIGRNCQLGEGCVLYPRVTIYPNTRIGDRVIIHAGAVIGSDGFGYSKIEGKHRKIPQIGGVCIENDVEIGANTTIDRSTLVRHIGKREDRQQRGACRSGGTCRSYRD
jgi:UDP-3-O-[3-hydroxymyristoyl] glucosamine N-acyltransferase